MLKSAGCLFIAVSMGPIALSQPQKPLGKDYENLRPQQRRLIDDLIARYGRTVGRRLDPVAAYNDALESQRTTFDAVTHALLNTSLTDEAGKKLGTALDLVESVDEVAGESPGQPGDRQFRVYFFLKPDAYEVLSKSREFLRGPDNSTFHRGYPICFRLPRTPSIQFSLSADHHRADVDVDYRSSKFPASLVNGHLKASNSDVRAGSNDTRHNSRWAGLVAWWTSLFSFGDQDSGKTALRAGSIPPTPPKGNGRIEEAAADFFNQWWTARDVGKAVSYFSRDSYGCIAKDAARRGQKIEPGMTRAYLARRMEHSLKSLPQGKSLKDSAAPVPSWAADLKPIKHDGGGSFTLAQAPRGYAEAFDCDGDTGNNLGKGDVYVTAFSLPRQDSGREEIGFLWQKDGASWRIVSAMLLNSDTRQTALGAAAKRALEAARITEVEGDPDLIRAATDFAEQWWLKRQPAKALEYLSAEAYGCLAQNTERAVPKTVTEQRRALLNGMRTSLSAVPEASLRLQDVLTSPEPAQDGTRVVKHANQDAVLLVSISDQAAALLKCGERADRAKIAARLGQERTYGQAYVSAFQVKTSGDPGVFYLAWRKEAQGWRAFFWQVETP